MGQATTAIIDGLANMSGLILGNHIFGKAIGISDEYLSPMSVKKNADGSMSVQNNIPFLRDFNEINLQYKNNEISAEQKSAMIDGLKEKIQSGDTSVVTTIRSVRELETLIKDTLEYVNLSETQTKFDMDYKERLTKLLETGLDNP